MTINATAIKTQNEKAAFPRTAQARASEPSTSVWVSASAGSGKTTVLTNRVLRLLLAETEPAKIICLTFTRAAAAEMTLRVMNKLVDWATCEDDALRADLDQLQDQAPKSSQLLRARRLFSIVVSSSGGLRIHTLHAFCQEILRRFPIEAGLPPHFSVLEDNEAKALYEEVLSQLLKDINAGREAAESKALHHLVSRFGERGLKSALLRLLSESARLIHALNEEGGLEPLLNKLRTENKVGEKDNFKDIISKYFQSIPHAAIRKAANWLLDGTPSYRARATTLLGVLDRLPGSEVGLFEDYTRCFLTQDDVPFQNYANKDLLALHPELANIFQDEAECLMAVRRRLEVLSVVLDTEALVRFGHALIERHEKYKSQFAFLDYNDLITRTKALLSRPGIAPWVLFKLDGGLDHILVDEAQDTSREQWDILSLLTEEFFSGRGARDDKSRTLFVVGDEKQSIFSFQRADPEAFSSMQHFFSERIKGAGFPYHQEPLRVSFRSAPAILKAVDMVFSSERVRRGVSSETMEHAVYHENKIGRVEVWPLQKGREKDEDHEVWPLPLQQEKEVDPEARLADSIADKIKDWMVEGTVLPGEAKPIAARDIMILLRRRGRLADLMVRALKTRQIPVTGVDRMRLIQQLPVMDLMALIQFVLLPEDDLTLATVLKGPFINMDEENLMDLALQRQGSLWHRLREKSDHDAAYGLTYAYLKDILASADYSTPFMFLSRILYGLTAEGSVSGRHSLWQRLGPDALDPVQELLTTALDYSQNHTPSLQAFLHWLNLTDSEVKRELDHGGDQVRIMTVHASKGLEAPIVFLPDAASTPRLQDVPELLWHNNIPYAMPIKRTVGLPGQLWSEARTRQLEEYRRLLYVAMTRAANRLYIGGIEPPRNDRSYTESWHALASLALKAEQQPSKIVDPEVTESDVIVLSDSSSITTLPSKPAKNTEKIAEFPLPDWARMSVPRDPLSLTTLIPSSMQRTESGAKLDGALARGRILHRLLEFLPEVEDEQRENRGNVFLKNNHPNLTEDTRQSYLAEVLRLIRSSNYATLFGPTSRPEVSLVGRLGTKRVPGRVDRLAIDKDTVWLVDYKSDRQAPAALEDVPRPYALQLLAYKSMLADIYPTKQIRCLLLYTYQPCLLELSAEYLAKIKDPFS